MHASSRIATSTLCALLFLGGEARAQHLVAQDGLTGDILLLTGGPGLCGYPSGGPVQATIVLNPSTGSCTMPGPPGDPAFTSNGSVSYIPQYDAFRTTDDAILGAWDSNGDGIVASDMGLWGLGPITGSAFHPGGGGSGFDAFWMTDGTKVIQFNTGVACGGVPGGYSLSFADYAGPGILTGLGWNPFTSTLWACTDLGQVLQFDVNGVQLSSFSSTLTGTKLSGLAVDRTDGAIFVTDGSTVVRYSQTGGVLLPRLWWSQVLEASAAPLVGLDFVHGGVNFGVGLDLGGGSAPHLTSSGEPLVGTSGFSLDVTGAPTPPTTYFYFYSVSGTLCPFIPVAGLPLVIAPPIYTAGSAPANGQGVASLSVPIPNKANFAGAEIFVQALGLPQFGGLRMSEGYAFTIGLE